MLPYMALVCSIDWYHRAPGAYSELLPYHKTQVKSDRVSLNELSMCAANAPRLGSLVTLEKEEAEKQWKAFIFMSPNLLLLHVRVRARAGVGGGGVGG